MERRSRGAKAVRTSFPCLLEVLILRDFKRDYALETRHAILAVRDRPGVTAALCRWTEDSDERRHRTPSFRNWK
jgi:hypothetical protein